MQVESPQPSKLKHVNSPNDYIVSDDYRSPEFNQCAIQSNIEVNQVLSS